MAVLIIADNPGQTAQGYDSMLAVLATPLRRAPGLILHGGYASPDGWRVIEVWDAKAEADRFFARFVAPHLPSRIRPKRSTVPLHSLVLFEGAQHVESRS